VLVFRLERPEQTALLAPIVRLMTRSRHIGTDLARFPEARFWTISVWPANRALAGLVGDAHIGDVTFYVVKSVRSAWSNSSRAA
jgi:hypothetical protein